MKLGIADGALHELVNLPQIARLTELDLSSNEIRGQGAEALASSETLKNCKIFT